MRSEARALDEVLGTVAERLTANRAQLGDDTARLMKLGEEASDRLGRVTHYLSREAEGLKVRSDAVESAAAQARVDIGVLLADLPQAEQSARSFSEAMRDAGVTAHERARALEVQLSAIAARAHDADLATGGAAERLGAHISRIESSAGVAAEQLDEAAARMDAASTQRWGGPPKRWKQHESPSTSRRRRCLPRWTRIAAASRMPAAKRRARWPGGSTKCARR
jgi:hypothetical protein